MNFQEIVEVLEKLTSKNSFSDDYDEDDSMEKVISTVGPCPVVDQKGGEGKGESWYIIRHFTDHNVFIRLNGYYSSYSGVDFDGYDYVEVKPKVKTITVYEKD
jgi:hypothetical protein